MRPRTDSTWVRAIVGAVALYALLVQAFLASAQPLPAFSPAGILCAEHGPAAPDDGTPVRHDHPCCLALHAGPMPLPSAAASIVAWAPPDAVPLAWRPEASLPKTGPPLHAPSARGPPHLV